MSVKRKDEVEDVKGSFDEEYLQEYLNRVAYTLRISSPKYAIESGSKKGDNYVAVVYRVSIEGETDGVPAKVDTIFKVAQTDDPGRFETSAAILFSREHMFYTEIVPIFDEFLKTKNNRLQHVPRCYFSSDDDHEEAIFLEDLRPKGFVMRDRIKQLDFAHASLALRALGRLHAVSFALRDQRPDIFSKKIAVVKEPLFRPEFIADEIFIDRFENLGKLAETALAEEDPKYRKRFSEFFIDAVSRVERSCHGIAAEPYAVLCHGDFSTNNMLFKYEENSEVPQDIYLLDFQLSRFASPATDISFNLFCSCSQELRAKHFDELIKIYHDSLSDHLLELGSDPKKLFPFEALLDQMKRFSTHGAGTALIMLPLLTSQGDDVLPDGVSHFSIPRFQERMNRDQFFKNTYRDTFKDLIDRNYI